MKVSTPLFLLVALAAAVAHAEDYRPADEGQHPQGGGSHILPEQFLRGYDPVTLYYPGDEAKDRGPADEGAKKLKIAPSWPGAWFWADRRTLQFRPAEPWPALARFSVDGGGARRILTTMMSAPSSMSPSPDSDNLAPFRTVTLTFPQTLSLDSLKQMIKLEVRDLPGLADSPKRLVRDWTITQLPRGSHRDAAVYAITLKEDVPEGKQLRVDVSLALGDVGRTLWSAHVATRLPFHLEAMQCGNSRFSVEGGASVPKDMALACGNRGDLPQLVFSAPPQGLTLSTLARLVKLEPAVADLDFANYGSRIELRGRFVPDTLYRMRINGAPLKDDAGRDLKDPGDLTVYFYRGWKQPFLRWNSATALVEANGPRMVPLIGSGDPRADVRVYRVDPSFTGLWPFPSSPVVVNEETEPPFPGNEPAKPTEPGSSEERNLVAHLRMLGSPLVSKVVELPLAKTSSTTRFGLDIGALLDPVVGAHKPGTYLVGLRRLSGKPERTYMRVQITNLTLTSVTARNEVVLYVRTLDKAEPVRGAKLLFEGHRTVQEGYQTKTITAQAELTTDGEGKATQGLLKDWSDFSRVTISSGEDTLVLDPNDPPPRFWNRNWGTARNWLDSLRMPEQKPVNDRTLAFVFSERPIYRPGEAVFLKGYVRNKASGKLVSPGNADQFSFRVDGPSGQSWSIPVAFTALAGFSGTFQEKDLATGEYRATLFRTKSGEELAHRTFKIEAYRIPTFELQLASPPSVRLDGPFKVKAVARYYAGGNVADAPIAWTVTRKPYHYIPKGRSGYLFADSNQFGRDGAARSPETITRSGSLDATGAHEISINPALDVDGSARMYRFEATVTGPDEQQVSAVQDVKALPPFILGLKMDRYKEQATEISPDIIAVGVDDRLLANQDVTVKFYRRVWHSVLRETHFATGQAKYVTEQEDVKLLEKEIKTGTDPVSPKLPIKESGVYVVELVARDKLGRVQTLSADLYVGGKGSIAWQKSREGVFELGTDKTKYRPGETARVVIQSPFQNGRALVIVEEPEGNSYSWHDVSGGKAVHELKVRPEHVPNLPIHVVLMRGRVGEGGTEDGRYRPQTLASSLELEVEPAKNLVDVGLKFPESARPGSTVNVTVTLADDNAKPISGEVTLWLVDEAVLSLAKEETLDPLTAFIVKNAATASVWDTRNLVVGRLMEQEEDPGGDGDDDGEGGMRKRVRKDFKTVPYYEATLQVPESGKLVVPIKLSDDLTNFRMRAVAASGFMRFGLKQDTLHVRLPLLVQPQLPRFIREGDRFWGGGIARLLEGTEGPGSVDMTVTGPIDGATAAKDVSLLNNKPVNALTPLTARSTSTGEESTVTVRVGVTRKSDGQGDAFEVKLPVLPDRLVERFAYITRLGANTTTTLKPLPEPARAGTVHQQIVATSVPGVLDLAASLDYLITYPHGCLEQRVSQVQPELTQGALLKTLGLEEGYGPKAMMGTKKVLGELKAHQDEQGLFGYWPGSQGDIQLTAQVLGFIAAAKKAGLTVDPMVESRAKAALQRVLRSDYNGFYDGYRWNQQTVALRALAQSGLLDEHYLIDLFQNRARIDTFSLSQLIMAMSSDPGRYQSNLDALKKDLWGALTFKLVNGQEILSNVSYRRDYWGGYYLGSNTATLASTFEALLLVDPGDKRHALIRDAIIERASATNGWGSTYDNRLAIEALALYLEKAHDPLPTTKVKIGSTELSLDTTHRVARGSFGDVQAGATVSGGEIGARISTTYLPSTPGTDVAPLKQGFLVSRSWTPIKADGSSDNAVDDRHGETRRVAQGDVVEVHANLVNDEEKYFVAFVVPFAAGFEPLNPELQTSGAIAKPSSVDSETPTYVQRLDNEVRYYFNRLPKGNHSFHFRLRATTEGSFVHPAPWAEQMYKQEVRGRGEGLRVIVTGQNEK